MVHDAWSWFRISSRYFFLYLTLKNDEVQHAIPVVLPPPQAGNINSLNSLVCLCFYLLYGFGNLCDIQWFQCTSRCKFSAKAILIIILSVKVDQLFSYTNKIIEFLSLGKQFSFYFHDDTLHRIFVSEGFLRDYL